jgi:hypothetical protein
MPSITPATPRNGGAALTCRTQQQEGEARPKGTSPHLRLIFYVRSMPPTDAATGSQRRIRVRVRPLRAFLPPSGELCRWRRYNHRGAGAAPQGCRFCRMQIGTPGAARIGAGCFNRSHWYYISPASSGAGAACRRLRRKCLAILSLRPEKLRGRRRLDARQLSTNDSGAPSSQHFATRYKRQACTTAGPPCRGCREKEDASQGGCKQAVGFLCREMREACMHEARFISDVRCSRSHMLHCAGLAS